MMTFGRLWIAVVQILKQSNARQVFQSKLRGRIRRSSQFILQPSAQLNSKLHKYQIQ